MQALIIELWEIIRFFLLLVYTVKLKLQYILIKELLIAIQVLMTLLD